MTAIPWLQPDWDQRVHDFLVEASVGIDWIWEESYDVVKETPWAFTARANMRGDHPLYLKVVIPELASEVGLTIALSDLSIDHVPNVLAANKSNHWFLTPDAGDPLRQWIASADDLPVWEPVLEQYAALQQATTPHIDNWIADGIIEDRSPAKLPDQFADLLDNHRAQLLIDQEGGLGNEQLQVAYDALPKIEALCQVLIDSGIPNTLHHDDFHANNVWIKDGHITIADWGEACVTHPFCSMMIVGRATTNYLGWNIDETYPAIDALYAHYLSHWSAYGTVDELWETLQAALVIGRLNRLLIWMKVLHAVPSEYHGEDADAVARWVENLLMVL